MQEEACIQSPAARECMASGHSLQASTVWHAAPCIVQAPSFTHPRAPRMCLSPPSLPRVGANVVPSLHVAMIAFVAAGRQSQQASHVGWQPQISPQTHFRALALPPRMGPPPLTLLQTLPLPLFPPPESSPAKPGVLWERRRAVATTLPTGHCRQPTKAPAGCSLPPVSTSPLEQRMRMPVAPTSSPALHQTQHAGMQGIRPAVLARQKQRRGFAYVHPVGCRPDGQHKLRLPRSLTRRTARPSR